MKKLAFITGGIIATNVVANISIKACRASGGTIGGMAFLVMSYLTPAPLNYVASPRTWTS